MPIQKCTINGEAGWRWGTKGKCYGGKKGKQKAIAQAIAIGGGKMPIKTWENTDFDLMVKKL